MRLDKQPRSQAVPGKTEPPMGKASVLTWAGHALSALDEVVLEALVSAHLPRWQALTV